MEDFFSARLASRSTLNFFVLVVFALGFTLFILKKANEAIDELKNLVGQEIYLKSSVREIKN